MKQSRCFQSCLQTPVTHLLQGVPLVLNVIQKQLIGSADTFLWRRTTPWLLSGLAQSHTSLQLTDHPVPRGCLGETSKGQVSSWLELTEQHPLPPWNRAHLAAEVIQKQRIVSLTRPSTHFQIRVQYKSRELLLFAEVNLQQGNS